ncbi:MAG: hypothetical protein HUK22_02205 [Thermoguttaceae bacterium]|nr:hypothetical protein [Thermoguttaceae bacterium]
MKIRMTAICFALVSVFAANVFAQDCAPCAAAAKADCASCATCTSCTGGGCELFGGLRSLLACRPCLPAPCFTTVSCAAPAPCEAATCGPVAMPCAPVAPTCGTCDVPAPTCGPCLPCIPICRPFARRCAPPETEICGGPMVATNMPTCGPEAECGSCDFGVCMPAPCVPCVLPCLKNAICTPIKGVGLAIHNVFQSIADATAPVDCSGLCAPSLCSPCGDVTCGGSCGTCGFEAAPAPAPCMPAAPTCR